MRFQLKVRGRGKRRRTQIAARSVHSEGHRQGEAPAPAAVHAAPAGLGGALPEGSGGLAGQTGHTPPAQRPTAAAGRRRRRTSVEVDTLRARALCGDPLAECSDSDREWVWRSLLKGVRLAEACVLAELEVEQLEPVLASIRHAYQRRSRAYRSRTGEESARAGTGAEESVC